MRFHKSLIPISVLAAALACGGGGGGSSSSTAPPPASAATVVYLTLNGSQFDIYAIKADGTGNRALATSSDSEVALQMAGNRVIYQRTTAGQTDLFSVKLDGTGTAALANTAVNEKFISYSGGRIVYLQQNAISRDLYSVNPDGTGSLLLARSVLSDAYGNNILTDGDQIVFTSLLSGAGDLYSIHADGTGLTTMANGSTRESVSGYAPSCLDSTTGMVVYTRDEGSGNSTIHAVKPDGTGHVQLTSPPAPVSPGAVGSGSLVYWLQTSASPYRSSVYSMRLDGSGSPVALAADPAWNQFSQQIIGGRAIYGRANDAYTISEYYSINLDGTGRAPLSPSGQDFLYTGMAGSMLSLQQGNYSSPTTRVYVVNADGTGLTPLTPSGGSAFFEGSWNGRIYYILQQAGQFDLFSCAPDGSGITTLASRPDLTEQSPKQAGDRIVYDLYQPTGTYAGIVSVKPDGTGTITLATGPSVTSFVVN